MSHHPSRRVRAAAALLAVASLSGCSLLQPDVLPPPASVAPQGSVVPAPSAPTPSLAARPTVSQAPSTPAPTTPPLSPDEYRPLTGSDGRWTVLVVGSDYRKGHYGERTDTIMVVSVDPQTGRLTAASLPRDTAAVPIGPNRVFGERINALFESYTGRGMKELPALRRLGQDIAYALRIEIDNVAMTTFDGFRALVKRFGGVDVRIARPLDDDHVGSPGPRRIHLKKGWNHLGSQLSLAFVRTRHSDSDYERARRQQQFLMAAGIRIRELGLDAMPDLLAFAMTQVTTDIDPARLPLMLDILAHARFGAYKGVVLGPMTYATEGTVLYTTVLRIAAVRDLAARFFGPVR